MRRRRWVNTPWWYRHPLELLALEGGFPAEYVNFRRHVRGKALVYIGSVEVGDAGSRRLTLIFPGRPARITPIVMADGPRTLRHRYRWARPTSLCIWYPPDPVSQRWNLREGLHGLIDRVRVHLLKEAWWRVHGSWPSPEIHHEPRGGERRASAPSRAPQHRERQRCWCGRGRYSSCHGAIDAESELEQLGLG
jgi:hypothetical protein